MQKHSSTGFTLVELMIALSIVAILATVVVPSFQNSIKNNRAVSQSNALATALAMARSEAIKRNASVVVCSTTDQTSCSGNIDWSTGWLVFVDADKNNSLSSATCTTGADNLLSSDCILRIFPAITGEATLTSTVDFTTYGSSGTASAVATFNLKPSDCQSNEQLRLNVNLAGRVYAEKVSCS